MRNFLVQFKAMLHRKKNFICKKCDAFQKAKCRLLEMPTGVGIQLLETPTLFFLLFPLITAWYHRKKENKNIDFHAA
jgi:hypothetical protein